MTKKLIVFQKKNGGNLCTGIKTKKKKKASGIVRKILSAVQI